MCCHWYTRVFDTRVFDCHEADSNHSLMLVSQVRITLASIPKKVAVFGIHLLPSETNVRVASSDRLLLAVGNGSAAG